MLKEFNEEKLNKGIEEFKKFLQFKQDFELRWLTKFDNLSKEKRAEIIRKIVDKYSSDKYIDGEYNKGYEPRCSLYDLLFAYGAQCGEEIEYCKNPHFGEEQYLIDDSILVAKVYGQGEYIYVKFLEEDHYLRELENDFHKDMQKLLSKWANKINGEYTINGTFDLMSHKHYHNNSLQKETCEKFTIDSFKFDINEPTISYDNYDVKF